jgi:hypothetical protein
MSTRDSSSVVTSQAQRAAADEQDVEAKWRQVVERRSFLGGVGLAGAAAVPGSALLSGSAMAGTSRLTGGDVAILRFLAAVELIESDLWQQYNDLGAVNGGNPAYMAALSKASACAVPAARSALTRCTRCDS